MGAGKSIRYWDMDVSYKLISRPRGCRGGKNHSQTSYFADVSRGRGLKSVVEFCGFRAVESYAGWTA